MRWNIPRLGCHSVVVGSPREVKSATGGKAELALPTLAIAEVPVAELPVRDRLLLWENSQLVQFRIQNEATLKSEDKNDAAQLEATDPYAGGVLIQKRYSTFRSVGYAHISHIGVHILEYRLGGELSRYP